MRDIFFFYCYYSQKSGAPNDDFPGIENTKRQLFGTVFIYLFSILRNSQLESDVCRLP